MLFGAKFIIHFTVKTYSKKICICCHILYSLFCCILNSKFSKTINIIYLLPVLVQCSCNSIDLDYLRLLRSSFHSKLERLRGKLKSKEIRQPCRHTSKRGCVMCRFKTVLCQLCYKTYLIYEYLRFFAPQL